MAYFFFFFSSRARKEEEKKKKKTLPDYCNSLKDFSFFLVHIHEGDFIVFPDEILLIQADKTQRCMYAYDFGRVLHFKRGYIKINNI